MGFFYFLFLPHAKSFWQSKIQPRSAPYPER
jgi:hypothetical protein